MFRGSNLPAEGPPLTAGEAGLRTEADRPPVSWEAVEEAQWRILYLTCWKPDPLYGQVIDLREAYAELEAQGVPRAVAEAAFSVYFQTDRLVDVPHSDLLFYGTVALVEWARQRAWQRAQTKAGGSKARAILPSADASMRRVLAAMPEAYQWSARRWARYLGCSVATIHGTPTWKKIMATRQSVTAEARADREKRAIKPGER